MDLDFLLIQRMRMGDEKAIEAFVKKYYEKILKYCQVHLVCSSDAEDLVQETFVRFFSALDRYHHYGKAVNYLYAIATNLCKDFYRKNREIPVEELPESEEIKSVDRNGEIELRMDVCRALEKMPGEIKEVTVLFFFEEKKQKEIAKILGIGLPLVKYRIHRARELLEEYFREDSPQCRSVRGKSVREENDEA